MKTLEDKIVKLLETKRRNDLIMMMRKAGYTYEEIGAYVGLTRQRVHQIISEIEKQDEKIINKK